MERLARIADMERKLDASLAAVRALDQALDGYEQAQESIRELEAYLGSRAWREDFEADERGLLPASLKRGVLSEDGISALLDERDELLQRLASL